jgi:hypothetical protein
VNLEVLDFVFPRWRGARVLDTVRLGSGPINFVASARSFMILRVAEVSAMSDLSWQSDRQMELIKPYFPLSRGIRRR